MTCRSLRTRKKLVSTFFEEFFEDAAFLLCLSKKRIKNRITKLTTRSYPQPAVDSIFERDDSRLVQLLQHTKMKAFDSLRPQQMLPLIFTSFVPFSRVFNTSRKESEVSLNWLQPGNVCLFVMASRASLERLTSNIRQVAMGQVNRDWKLHSLYPHKCGQLQIKRK